MRQQHANRTLCLLEELETSRELLRSGFGHLQEIDMANTFYHLPHQLLASGFERLMKCYVILVDEGRHGAYPSQQFLKGLGHDLEKLLRIICRNYYGGMRRRLVQQELRFLQSDAIAKECLRVLSLFGKKGRYYNLDVVTGGATSPIDPTNEWERLESSVEDPAAYHGDLERLHRDYYPRVHAKLIAKMERVIRAIALQFTIGGHSDRTGRLRQMSTVYAEFQVLRDEALGTIDYRRSVQILTQERDTWIKQSEEEVVGGPWPTQIVTKQEFDGEWPFRVDRVILEQQDATFYVVYINGYAFALNGAAKSHLGIPFPHDAGFAVLGRSVAAFIEATRMLG